MIWANKKKITFTFGSNFSIDFSANAWWGVIDGLFIAALIAVGSLQTTYPKFL